jgi:mannosyltransferase OCH1-like enzyme
MTTEAIAQARIPRTIHQIWFGPNPRPQQWMSTWRERHPGWSYQLWTEETLPQLANQRLFETLGSLWHGKADLARYEILHRYGGVYIDADAECVRPLVDQGNGGAGADGRQTVGAPAAVARAHDARLEAGAGHEAGEP